MRSSISRRDIVKKQCPRETNPSIELHGIDREKAKSGERERERQGNKDEKERIR